jgi:hypothetical protein
MMNAARGNHGAGTSLPQIFPGHGPGTFTGDCHRDAASDRRQAVVVLGRRKVPQAVCFQC